jgi:hypothetical protein
MATNQQAMTKMQIGKIAKRTSLTVDAIRFYEKRKLLPRRFAAQVASAPMERAVSDVFTSSSKCKNSVSPRARPVN